jgi:hypothetical protein
MFKLILAWRVWLESLPWLKKCYNCENILPLVLFKVNNSKYKRPSQKGRCFNCKICVIIDERKYKKRKQGA